MFTKVVIDKIKNILSSYQKLQISINNQQRRLSKYDYVNALLFYNSIIDERLDDLVIFHPSGSTFLINMLIISAFAELEIDMTNVDNELIRNLKIGQKVKVDGSLGIYQGTSKYKGEDLIRIECGGKHADVLLIKMTDQHRIQSYYGGATKLRGHKRKGKQSSGIILSNILDIKKQLLSIVRTSFISVITDKKDFIELIKSAEISGSKFTHIFPTAKAQSFDKYNMIGGSRAGEKPVIYIMSSFNVVEDFLAHGQEINLLIIDGSSKINYSQINHIKDQGKVENIIVLLNHCYLDKKEDLEKIGFKPWVWVREDFKDLIDSSIDIRKGSSSFSLGEFTDILLASELINTIENSGISVPNGKDDVARLNSLLKIKQLRHYFLDLQLPLLAHDLIKREKELTENELVQLNRLVLEKAYPQQCPKNLRKYSESNLLSNHYRTQINLSRKEVRSLDVSCDINIFEEIKEGVKQIKLFKKEVSNIERDKLLIASYGLLNYFSYLPFPASYPFTIDDRKDAPLYDPEASIGQIIEYRGSLSSYFFSSEITVVINSLIENFDKLLQFYIQNNSKADALVNLLKGEKEKVAVIVYKDWQVGFLESFLRKHKVKNINIFPFQKAKKMVEDEMYDKVIFLGWFGNENRYIYYSGNSSQYEILLYPFEKKSYEYCKKKATRDSFYYRNKLDRAHLLNLNEELFLEQEMPQKEEAVLNIEEDIFELIKELNSNIASSGYDYANVDPKELIKAKYISFDDGSYGYFSSNYKGKKLLRSENKIETTDLDVLEIGDELIFFRDNRDDIFAELIKIVEESGTVTEEIALSKLWKTSLLEYLKSSRKSVLQFVKELEIVGCVRGVQAVENWLANPRLIGPEDPEKTLVSIYLVTKDPELNKNIIKISQSCKKLQSLHIKLGHYLSRCIISSLDEEKEENLEGFLAQKVKELSQCLKVIQITSISDNPLDVPRNKTNRLVESL
jgi:dsDNA-binding SOS-regulon protein